MNYTEAVDKAKQGENDAFTFLYEQTYQKAYYIALKYLKNETVAQDVLQEAYVAAFKSLEQLDDPEKFPAWLSRIVATRSLNELKKKNPMLFSETENEEGQDISETFEDDRVDTQPELSIDQKETQRLIREIIEALSEEQRVCITMFYLDDMPVKEIAEILQVSENTVKSRLNYGRQKIKDKVLELEKKGTKLYGLAPIPFFLLLCREEASAAEIAVPAFSAASCAEAASAGKTILGGTLVAGAKGLTTKIVAGVIAGTLLVGGGAAAVIHSQKDAQKDEVNDEIPIWATRCFEHEEIVCGKFISLEGYERPLFIAIEEFDESNHAFILYFDEEGLYMGYGVVMDDNNFYLGEYEGSILMAWYSDNYWESEELLTAEQYAQVIEDADLLDLYIQQSDIEKAVSSMLSSQRCSVDNLYCLTLDDLYKTAEDAYYAWLEDGEEEKEKIYASRFDLIENKENITSEINDEIVEDVPKETELETEAQTESETEYETESEQEIAGQSEKENTINYDISAILGPYIIYESSLIGENNSSYKNMLEEQGMSYITSASVNGDYLTITGSFTAYDNFELNDPVIIPMGTYEIPLNEDVYFYSSGGQTDPVDIDDFGEYLEKVQDSGLTISIYVEDGIVQGIGILS
ncbi:MAG: RNA polymerase sigma factor [Lachnospiraceae bacterium]